MNDHELEPLPPECAELLDTGAPEPLTPERRARVLRRVEASVALAGLASAPGAPSAPPPPVAQVSAGTGTGTGAATATTTAATGATGLVLAKVVTLSVAAAVAGSLAYRATGSFEARGPEALSQPEAVRGSVAAPVAAPEGQVQGERNALESTTSAAQVQAPDDRRPDGPGGVEARAPTRPRAAAPGAPRSQVVTQVPQVLPGASVERALVEQARAALLGLDTSRALELVERHRRDFPSGVLREERESLAAHALVQAGRLDEAREAASRFKRDFPESVFGPAMEELVREK